MAGVRVHISTDPFCDVASVGRQLVALCPQRVCVRVSPIVTIAADGTADLQDLSGLYQLDRDRQSPRPSCAWPSAAWRPMRLPAFQYKPKFGNILMFVLLALAAILATFLRELALGSHHGRGTGPVLPSGACRWQAVQRQARQWRHPVLDHLAAHPAACRGDHSRST